MTATPSCPYCNAVVAVPAGTRDGQFVPCPRCGERFPYRGPSVEENGTPAAPAPAPPAAPEHVVDRVGERLRGWSKRTLLLIILTVMVVMAAASLMLALATEKYRRANDRPSPPPDEGAPRVRVVAPADLAGLGYLPADTDVIAALHVALALQEPAGREVLRRFRLEALVRGRPEDGRELAGDLEHWTGVAVDDLDHVVVGLKVAGGAIPPRLVLVAQTRRRYDEDKVLTALKAKRVAETKGRRLYQFHLDQRLPEAVLWPAGDHTLVVTLTAGQMAEVPDLPQPGATHQAAPLQEVLRTRLGLGAQAWVVGHADDWERTTLAFVPKDDRAALDRVRTFGVALQFGDGLTLTGAFHGADAAAAKRLEERLAPAEGGARKTLPLLGGRAGSGPVARELARTLAATREDAWLTLQAKVDPQTLREALAPPKP
jgi:hypothetical protein